MNEMMMLRNSERTSFKTCPQQWHWAWVMGLVPAIPRQDARWFGTGLHLCLATWYTPEGAKNGFARGPEPQETWAEFTKTAYASVATQPYWGDENEKEWVDAKVLGDAMLAGYRKHYGNDPMVEVLFPEWRYSTKIPYNARQKALIEKFFPNGAGDYTANTVEWLWKALEINPKFLVQMLGTFDMVFLDHTSGRPRAKIMDHKSAKQKTSGAHLEKDDQAGTYIAVSTSVLRAKKVIGPKDSVTGMTYNYLRKALPPKDESIDPETGIKYNKPGKEHYAKALAAAGAGIESELIKIPIEPKAGGGLGDIARRLNIVVRGEKSAVQPQPLFWREDVPRNNANRIRQISRIADDAEMIDRARSGEMPIMKNPGDHCAWCDFRDLCDVDENGGDTPQFIKDVFVSRDPYADHRPDAINSKTSVAADKTVKSNVTRVNFGMPS